MNRIRNNLYILLLILLAIFYIKPKTYSLEYVDNKTYLTPNVELIKGDMNKNGKIDLSDIIILLKVYLNGDVTDEELQIGDMDNNTVIGLRDIILLLKEYLNVPESSLIEVKFLKTQNSANATNESIILKTGSGKIILIDTANKTDEIYNTILENLRSFSNSEKVVIDYLIISHSHSDHVGNLKNILNNEDITINNIIYKKEKHGSKIDGNTVEETILSLKKENTNVIETTSLNATNKTVKEYDIDDNVSISLLNLTDVLSRYSTSECSKKYYSVKFHSMKHSYNIKYNDNYIYLNSLNPEDDTLYTSMNVVDVGNDLELTDGIPNRKYYAYFRERTSLCNANANSIAILVKVKTDIGDKYIYIPSDLENNGYSFFGNVNKNSGFLYEKIFGNGTTYIYENTFDLQTNSDTNNAWSFDNNFFVDTKESIKVASESRVANVIKDYIGEDNLNNIVIYQQSHHGFNNAKDAIDTLNINRKNVFSIATSMDTGKNSSDALLARSFHYTLSNTQVLTTGNSENGVYCYINGDGSYNCA